MNYRTAATMILTLAITFASTPEARAAGKAQLLRPTLEIEQLGGLPAMTQHAGPVLVQYELTVHNPSLEPITLHRIELGSTDPVSSYYLRREARPYDVKIDPESSATVKYTALATARGGLVGAQTPVSINGAAVFSSPVGGFSVPIIATIGPKSTKMLN
jgi:hypothetical protein